MKLAFRICLVFTVLQFAAAIAAYRALPGLIPIHWGLSGEIDGYGGKYMIFLSPALSLLITIGMTLLPKIDPKGENILRSGKSYPALMIALNLLMAALLAVMLSASFGRGARAADVILGALGVMFLLLGNYMPKIKHNYTFGIKLPWTLASETVWARTHRVGGVVFFAAGLLFLAGVFFPAPYGLIAPLAFLLAGTLGVSIYSYCEYKKL